MFGKIHNTRAMRFCQCLAKLLDFCQTLAKRLKAGALSREAEKVQATGPRPFSVECEGKFRLSEAMRFSFSSSKRAAVAVAVAVLALFPRPAAAWSGSTHRAVTIRAFLALAAKAGGDENLRQWGFATGFPSAMPDLWRVSDREAEAPRHWFEADRFPACTPPEGFGKIADEAEALAAAGMTRDELGCAPWAVVELMKRMEEDMRAGDWEHAGRCAAAMGHYVGDLHQPLHCTKNFDGGLTGQNGVHSRYEMALADRFLDHRALRANLHRIAPVEDPLAALVDWGVESAKIAQEVLAHDLEATAYAGGNPNDDAYYEKLWELEGERMVKRLNRCIERLASLYLTAWDRAGRPEVGPAPEELNTDSVWSGVAADPQVEAARRAARKKESSRKGLAMAAGGALILAGLAGVLGTLAMRQRKDEPAP